MFPGKTHIQKLNKNKIPQFFSSPDAIKITELQSEVKWEIGKRTLILTPQQTSQFVRHTQKKLFCNKGVSIMFITLCKLTQSFRRDALAIMLSFMSQFLCLLFFLCFRKIVKFSHLSCAHIFVHYLFLRGFAKC